MCSYCAAVFCSICHFIWILYKEIQWKILLLFYVEHCSLAMKQMTASHLVCFWLYLFLSFVFNSMHQLCNEEIQCNEEAQETGKLCLCFVPLNTMVWMCVKGRGQSNTQYPEGLLILFISYYQEFKGKVFLSAKSMLLRSASIHYTNFAFIITICTSRIFHPPTQTP